MLHSFTSTLDLPYHRPKDIELLGIAQAVGMVPAADNSFKYQNSLKGGKNGGRKGGLKGGKLLFSRRSVFMIQIKNEGMGGRAYCNVVKGLKPWDDNQIQALLKYVIANFGFGLHGGTKWTNWDTDGVEGCKKERGQSKLQFLMEKQ